MSKETNVMLPDLVGDGLLDGQEDAGECLVTTTTLALTNPRDKDSDDDGYSDGLEVLILITDPLNPDDPAEMTDSDGDGVPAGIDPDDTQADTDGDGYGDAYELVLGSDPANQGSKPTLGDVDNNGLTNNIDAIRLFHFILGNIATPGNLERADIKSDGIINNIDAIVLFNWILGNVPIIPN